MELNRESYLLYAITESSKDRDSLLRKVEASLKGGITALQYRNKTADYDRKLEEATAIKKLCDAHDIPLIINDDVDIAIKIGAAGVHVGQDDMPLSEVRRLVGENMIIGVSAHSVAEALEAENNGANYLGVGSVFPTGTKSNVVALPHSTLREITGAVDIPVVAIGGISRENMEELSGTGISGVALVSAIYSAEDIGKECTELLSLSKKITARGKI